MLSGASLARLHALEAKGDYDSPVYWKILTEELYPQMLCCTEPWPEPVTRAFGHLNQKIYGQRWGKSEFAMTGKFRNWERWDRLHEIKTRTLTIGSSPRWTLLTSRRWRR